MPFGDVAIRLVFPIGIFKKSPIEIASGYSVRIISLDIILLPFSREFEESKSVEKLANGATLASELSSSLDDDNDSFRSGNASAIKLVALGNDGALE